MKSRRNFRSEKGRGRVDLSSPVAKKSAIPAAADSNYIFGHRCEISRKGEGERSPIPPHRSNYLASARIIFPPISINSFLAPTLSPRTLLFTRPSPPPP